MLLLLFLSLSFISFFLSYPSLSSPLLSLFSLSLGDDTKSTTRVDVSLNPTQSKELHVKCITKRLHLQVSVVRIVLVGRSKTKTICLITALSTGHISSGLQLKSRLFYGKAEGPDQPAYLHNLIRTFVCPCRLQYPIIRTN